MLGCQPWSGLRMNQAKRQIDARRGDGGLLWNTMLPVRLEGATHRQETAMRQRQMQNFATNVVADIEPAFGAQAQ